MYKKKKIGVLLTSLSFSSSSRHFLGFQVWKGWSFSPKSIFSFISRFLDSSLSAVISPYILNFLFYSIFFSLLMQPIMDSIEKKLSYDSNFDLRIVSRLECFFNLNSVWKKWQKNTISINTIHGILISNNTYKKINSNYLELEKKRNIFDRKSLITTFFNLISNFFKKLVSSLSFEALSLFLQF